MSWRCVVLALLVPAAVAAQRPMDKKEVPGIDVFGGIDLNLTVGGMNAAAVEHMTQVRDAAVRSGWRPTRTPLIR